VNNRFDDIYATNAWGHGSGEGSLPIHTKGYVTFLEEFLLRRNIDSVVDMGCGDWQFAKSIHWRDVRYDGYDVASSVVADNQHAYSTDRIRFHLYSGDPKELPSADLLIAKDVLQHLPNDFVLDFLPHLSRFKYALLTNCVNPRGPTANRDIRTGDFRYLDLRLPPFNLEATEVFSFTKSVNQVRSMNLLKRIVRGPEWRKVVLLANNRKTGSRGDQRLPSQQVT
jgi:hypothetical protein